LVKKLIIILEILFVIPKILSTIFFDPNTITMSDIKRRLGQNITRLRREKGLTQVKLAEKVEISATFMMHIEHGTRGASLETIELLAMALDVDVAVLFYKHIEMSSIDDMVFGNPQFADIMTAKINATIHECFEDLFKNSERD